MEPIHSGSTTDRIIRTVLLVILICGWSVWSFWDGFVAWPRENVVVVLTEQIGIEAPDPLPAINPTLSKEKASEVALGSTVEEAASLLGGKPFQHADSHFYFGLGGYVRVEIENDRIKSQTWIDGPTHPPGELLMQKVIGVILTPIGLAFLIQLVRVLRTRVSLTDTGLRVGGRTPIPFDAMTGIRIGKRDGLSPGVALLEYTLADRRRTIKLDNYVLKEQPAIVAAICERKGFERAK